MSDASSGFAQPKCAVWVKHAVLPKPLVLSGFGALGKPASLAPLVVDRLKSRLGMVEPAYLQGWKYWISKVTQLEKQTETMLMLEQFNVLLSLQSRPKHIQPVCFQCWWCCNGWTGLSWRSVVWPVCWSSKQQTQQAQQAQQAQHAKQACPTNRKWLHVSTSFRASRWDT